jgi:hypothetical protein
MMTMGKRISFHLSNGNSGKESTVQQHSRGLVNGNGMDKNRNPARGSGLINGNGLTNGNSVTNIKKIVYSTGLVNGNGLTNGNGISCRDSQLKKRINGKGKIKRNAGRVLVIAVLLIIPLVFVNFRSPYNEGNGIYIDGNLGDWKNIEGCDDASDDQMINPSANIMNYRIFNYNEEERPWNSKLSFYLEVEGYIFGNPRPRAGNEFISYAVHIFIDSDRNSKTGYKIQGLGADLVIELEGHDGIVHTSDLLEFEGGYNQKDWNGFKKTGPISWALSDHVLETQIRSNPGLSSTFDVLFHVTDSRDNEDFSDTVVSNDKGRLILTSEAVAPDVLAPGGRDVCLLKLDLLARDADIELEHINVTLNENSEPSDIDEISLFIDDGDKIHTQNDLGIASVSLLGRNAFLRPDERVWMGMDNTTTLYVTVTISSEAASFGVAGLSIASREDIGITKGTVTLHSDTRMSYIGAVPETVSIDGAFADWEGIYGHEDGDYLPIIKQNTDMREYKVTADDGSLYFYLDVEGTIMGGTAVPMVPRYQSYSDIPVSKALPKKRVQHNGPEELQPQDDIPQELLGEDSIYIFVDSDQNASTGYSPVWLPMGAEHLVLVSGKDGEVLDTRVMTFMGSPDDSLLAGFDNPFLSKESGTGSVQWIARYEPEIEVETLSSELEARMGTGFLKAAESIDIFFVAANWNNNVIDTADNVIGEIIEKNTGLRSNNPYISGHMHPDDADNSDGDIIDYLNLDEDAPGDGAYEMSGDTSEPGVDWIELSFPGAGIPSSASINNITYYMGYNTTSGWTLTNDALSNITWRVGAPEYNVGNYTLSAPAGTDIDSTLIQSTNLPSATDLNSGNFTVRFRGIDGGAPVQDNLDFDYCYFTLNYSIPNIVINEVMFKPICGPYDVDWMYRKKITINSSLVAENLTDYPVLINITDTDLQSKARTDGYDILFTKSDGETKLDHEIETYNSSTGSMFSWVKIPYLSSITDTDIYMYYGNPNAQDQSNADGVWDINFTGAWHLKENASGIGNIDLYKDSTVYANHGDDNISADGQTGKIDGGQEFDGTDDMIDCGSDGSLNIRNAVTLEAWINMDARPAKDDWHNIFGKEEYYLYIYGNDNTKTILAADFWIDGSEVDLWNAGVADIEPSAWVYVVLTFDGTDIIGYINGKQDFTSNNPGTIDDSSDNDFLIGQYIGESIYFDGLMDEVRISNTARSAGWIATLYNNTNSSNLFISAGNQENITIPNWAAPNGTSNWLYRKEITIDSGRVVGDQIDFPVLIDIKDDGLKNRVRSDGRDILFTGSDMQTILDYEIEYFNKTQGKLVAWVKISALSSTVDTTIYMYYGNPNAYDLSDADAVWSNNFSAVWHLSESPADTPPQFEDSTSNDNNGTAVGSMTAGDQVNGKMDGSIDFDGTDDRINIPQNLSLDGSDNFTFSGWFRLEIPHNPSSSTSHLILEKYLDSGHNLAIILAGSNYDEGSGGLSQGSLVFKFNGQNGGDAYHYKWTSKKSWAAYTWYQFTCILNTTNNTRNTVYVNGIEDVGGQRGNALSSWLNYSSDWNIGGGNVEAMNIPAGVAYFDGRLDEMRIATTLRSDDWIATEFNNQDTSYKFHSLGLEQILMYQWVELYNNESTSVDLDGWMLSDNDGNTFNLSGAGFVPSGGYLICHINRLGTNNSANVHGPIINSSTIPIRIFESSDDLVLLDGQGYIVDYIAWGADQGADDDGAVTSNLWDDGDFINTSQLQDGQTIGRDKNSNDTDQPQDWQNATGYADPFGIDRSTQNGSTPGLQNRDGIPEFSEIVFPFAVILILFAVGRRKYRRLSKGEHRNPSHGLSKRSNIKKRCEQ